MAKSPQTLGRWQLQRLVETTNDNYRLLSRMLGRHDRYVRNHVVLGSPARLAPDELAMLARYFGVDVRTIT